ncbi:MAG TPA: hypothetical protein VEO73_08080 [Gemmatimonadales bacterium]|nr:hypothetical protein [Gemmatimonadales bacterium]
MRRRVRCACLVALVAASVPLRLGAQANDALYDRFNALSGWEFRRYAFDPGITLKSISQWDMPLVLVTPVGRSLSVDLTSYLVSGRVESYGGTTETLSGLTDTQLRMLYTVRRDRAVASLSFNLPTGKHSLSTSQFQVNGAVGSTYLAFPVSSFGTSLGVTGGLAYAQRVGEWNLGVSGSLRYLGSYAPFSNDTLTYSPGLEGRVRAGADRLLGQKARLLLGVTVSSFSTDVYSGSNALLSGWYSPGARVIVDAALVRVVGRATVTALAWDFYRRAGLTNGASNLETRENVLNAELRVAHPVGGGGRLQLEPMVAFRQWSPADYRGGRLYSTGVSARYGINDRLSAILSGRLDTGWVYARDRGFANLTGSGFTLWVRYQR